MLYGNKYNCPKIPLLSPFSNMTNFQNLPSELLENILFYLPKSISQIATWERINKKTQSLIKQAYWYEAFKNAFPFLSYSIGCEKKLASYFWKDAALSSHRIARQFSSLSFKRLGSDSLYDCKEEPVVTHDERTDFQYLRMSAALNSAEQNEYDKIQGNPIYDIDRITNKGVVGLVKYRQTDSNSGYESLVTFWEAPSWRLIRSFKVNFRCQLTSIQTIWMLKDDCVEKIRFFTMGTGELAPTGKILFRNMSVYQLNNNNVKCVAHLKLEHQSATVEIFYFSQASWRTFSDGNSYNEPKEDLKEWLKVVAPQHSDFDPYNTVFAVIFTKSTALPYRLNIHQSSDFDPLVVPSTNSEILEDLTSHGLSPAWQIKFGLMTFNKSMTHIRDPPQLSHLVLWKGWNGHFSVVDWRFGIKVGAIVQEYAQKQLKTLSLSTRPAIRELDSQLRNGRAYSNQSALCDTGTDIIFILPQNIVEGPNNEETWTNAGLRIVSLDCKMDYVEILSWDISFMLNVRWKPFTNPSSAELIPMDRTISIIAAVEIPWWGRAPHRLRMIAATTKDEMLPYSPPAGFQRMFMGHYYERMQAGVPVSIQSYKVYGTSISILTKSNELIAVDLESGNTLGMHNMVDKVNQDFVNIDVFNEKKIIISCCDGIFYSELN